MTVFLIAMMHGVPVLLSAVVFGTKTAIWVAAAIMAFVAGFFGNPAYMFVDWIGVATGALLGMMLMPTESPAHAEFEENGAASRTKDAKPAPSGSSSLRVATHKSRVGSLGLSQLIGDRYRVVGHRGEIIEDVKTGLQWQRCSQGQIWDGHACVGEAGRYTWEEAHHAGDSDAGWRLPNLVELRSLVYCSSGDPTPFSNANPCKGFFARPVVVPEAFPNTPRSDFWTGTPNANHSNFAYYVDFHSGKTDSFGHHSSSFRVRLVRGGQ